MEEQWRFYGFCNTLEQARYIAAQGLSAGLSESPQSWRLSITQCSMDQATWLSLLQLMSQQACQVAGLSPLGDAPSTCCRHPGEVSRAESQDAARGLLGQLYRPAAQVPHAGVGLSPQWQHGQCCYLEGWLLAPFMMDIMRWRAASQRGMGDALWAAFHFFMHCEVDFDHCASHPARLLAG